MPWEIKYHEETGIVETIYSGNLSKEELLTAAKATIKKGMEMGSGLFLGDCEKLQKSGSVLDVFELVKFYESLDIQKNWREAIVLPHLPDAATDINTYETMSRNRGFEIRVFQSRTRALQWLTG